MKEQHKNPTPSSTVIGAKLTEDALAAGREAMELAGYFNPPPIAWDRAFNAIFASIAAEERDSPVSSLSGQSDLARAAAQVLEWWHEWAQHEPEEEEAAAFKALEAAIVETGFEYDGD